MKFKEIELSDLDTLVEMFIETFNAKPWNDKWTISSASKG